MSIDHSVSDRFAWAGVRTVVNLAADASDFVPPIRQNRRDQFVLSHGQVRLSMAPAGSPSVGAGSSLTLGYRSHMRRARKVITLILVGGFLMGINHFFP